MDYICCLFREIQSLIPQSVYELTSGQMTSVVAQGFVGTQLLPVVLEDLKPAFGQSQEYAI